MKQPKAGRVPVIDNAFELNLPKLMRAAKASGTAQLILDDGTGQTVVVVAPTRLATFLGGRAWVVDIVPVQCLKGRVRPLLKCPRAHEGNFQSLYYWAGELGCRRCHGLRYRSNLAPSAASRARLARFKLLDSMRGQPGDTVPARLPRAWRKRYLRLCERLYVLSGVHYTDIFDWLRRQDAASELLGTEGPHRQG